MMRSALRTTHMVASASISRPVVARGIARPVIGASRVVKRSYHEKVIDHYENPRNVGNMNKLDQDVGTGLVGAPGELLRDHSRGETDILYSLWGVSLSSSSYVLWLTGLVL
jgi:hypothetical protein